MSAKETPKNKKAAETLGALLKTFGNTVSELLEDPELRVKATEFAESVVDAAAKVAQRKVKDEEVRARMRNVGKAAQALGRSLENEFKSSQEESK